MSSKAEQWLRDILQSVEVIESHVAGLNFERFRTDVKTMDAVERRLQRISEAAIRLGPEAEHFCPGLPWHNIRGIGNWLRHQYDRVDLDTVWHTATVEIVPLKASVKAALQQLQSATEPPNLG